MGFEGGRLAQVMTAFGQYAKPVELSLCGCQTQPQLNASLLVTSQTAFQAFQAFKVTLKTFIFLFSHQQIPSREAHPDFLISRLCQL